MTNTIKITEAEGTWSVRAGGAVLGESASALELREGDDPMVIYFPRADIATAFLDKTDKAAQCPHRGDATFYSVVTKSRTLENVAWSYDSPKDGMAQIAGHIAFYASENVTVEQL